MIFAIALPNLTPSGGIDRSENSEIRIFGFASIYKAGTPSLHANVNDLVFKAGKESVEKVS